MSILNRLKAIRKSGDGWTAKCPAHEDRQNSLSIGRGDDKWLLRCHAGCNVEEITRALGLNVADLFDDKTGGRGDFNPFSNRATMQPGLTLEAYAVAKQLPVGFLRGCGLSDISYDGIPAVRIPYLGTGSELLAVRFRIALEGDRFRWKVGSKSQLYGLNRLEEARHVRVMESDMPGRGGLATKRLSAVLLGTRHNAIGSEKFSPSRPQGVAVYRACGRPCPSARCGESDSSDVATAKGKLIDPTRERMGRATALV